MNQAKEQVQFIANSLKVETKRMDTGKTANLKTALLSLANLELDYHVQVRSLCIDCKVFVPGADNHSILQSRAAWEGLRSFLELSDEEIAESRHKAQASITYRRPGEESGGQIVGLL
jgi:hypothetical protein